jgi:hypothetical protein
MHIAHFFLGFVCGSLVATLAQNNPAMSNFWRQDGTWLTPSAVTQAAAVSMGAPQVWLHDALAMNKKMQCEFHTFF